MTSTSLKIVDDKGTVQQDWFFGTNEDAIFKYESNRPKFVCVFRLQKGIGKAKRGDYVIMDGPTILQSNFYTIAQWRDKKDCKGLDVSYDSRMFEFCGYYQKSGIRMQTHDLNHVDELPTSRDRQENTNT